MWHGSSMHRLLHWRIVVSFNLGVMCALLLFVSCLFACYIYSGHTAHNVPLYLLYKNLQQMFILIHSICNAHFHWLWRRKFAVLTVFARSFLDHKPKGQVTDKFKKPEKNYTSPNFFLPKHGGLEILIWLICQRRLLQWHPFGSLIKRICISAPVYF